MSGWWDFHHCPASVSSIFWSVAAMPFLQPNLVLRGTRRKATYRQGYPDTLRSIFDQPFPVPEHKTTINSLKRPSLLPGASIRKEKWKTLKSLSIQWRRRAKTLWNEGWTIHLRGAGLSNHIPSAHCTPWYLQFSAHVNTWPSFNPAEDPHCNNWQVWERRPDRWRPKGSPVDFRKTSKTPNVLWITTQAPEHASHAHSDILLRRWPSKRVGSLSRKPLP